MRGEVFISEATSIGLAGPFGRRHVFEVLLAHIRALLRRRETEAWETLRYQDLTLDTASRVARQGAREIDLTTTEYELLLLFMRNPERVLTRDVIVDKVWGYDFDGNCNYSAMQ